MIFKLNILLELSIQIIFPGKLVLQVLTVFDSKINVKVRRATAVLYAVSNGPQKWPEAPMKKIVIDVAEPFMKGNASIKFSYIV